MKIAKKTKIALALFLFAIAAAVGPALATDLKITTLSSRAEMVSGGDTLIKIEAPDNIALEKIAVTRNGVDVTKAFKAGKGHFLVGLVDGLKVGSNELMAKAGASSATLKVTDYPITGPIFSGPHDSPFICGTAESGLGEPIDCNCSIDTVVEYYYMSTSGKLTRLSDPKKYPADLATTTILSGKTVPYVVRVEVGTINRGIYQIAVLDDPASAKSDAYEPNDGWNGRIYMEFGGGCGVGHKQGTMGNFGSGGPGGANTTVLGKGYATVNSSLLAYSSSGNDTLVAETAMMLKGALYRDLRRAGLYGRFGRLRRLHVTAPDLPELPRHTGRDHDRGILPLRPGPHLGAHGRRPATPLFRGLPGRGRA
jgi:hypothetical protein